MTRVPQDEIRRLADISTEAAKEAARMPAEQRSAFVRSQLDSLAAHLSPTDRDRLDVELLRRAVATSLNAVATLAKKGARNGGAADTGELEALADLTATVRRRTARIRELGR
jgi:hypothetical protein